MAEGTRVTWSYGYTMNLGNFESLRVDHGVDDYVREGETFDQASERVKLKVQAELNEAIKEHKAELDSIKHHG